MKTIYKKTAKGDEEIQKRTYKLSYEHRFVLILVDGKSTADNIISRSSKQWNPKQCLIELETRNFIRNVDKSTQDPPKTGKLKQDLILTIKKHLPEKNNKIINKIINAESSKTGLSKAIDSGCMFIKLTVSEEISVMLKEELYEITENSTEI